jgi:hypothetical protein
LRKQRQCGTGVDPGVGVTALPFDDLARVLDVIETDVIGRERHPSPVRVIHAVCYAFGLAREKLGAAKYAVGWVDAIGDTEVAGRVFGQHHDAAHAGRRNRLRAPV